MAKESDFAIGAIGVMRGKEGNEGRKEGLAIAREMAESVLEHYSLPT